MMMKRHGQHGRQQQQQPQQQQSDRLEMLINKATSLGNPSAVATAATSHYTASRQNLRVIPMGGIEEVGENMTVLEYGNDLIVIDMGLAFPDDTMPGIDYIIPDTKWLEEMPNLSQSAPAGSRK